MKEVLFICQGNVGRSQMAEGFYKQVRGKDTAISAGTDDVGHKYNFIPRSDIVEVMNEKGVDISGQRIKQVTEELVQTAQTIVVLCEPDLLPDFMKSSGLNIVFKEVPDPYESSLDGVREIRDAIEKLVLGLLDESAKT